MGSRLRTALHISLLVSLSVLFTLAVFELGLRSAYASKAPYRASKILRHHPKLGWELVPGSYEFFNVLAFRQAKFSIGSLGLRSQAALTSSHRRITVVGDSFVFSEALSDGETFVDLLQERLGPRFEVVNAGVPGFGTGQEALFIEHLRSQGFDLGERILLVIFSNDISDNAGLDHRSMNPDPTKPLFEARGNALRSTEAPPWPEQQLGDELAGSSLALALVQNRGEIALAMNPWLLRLASRAGLSVPLPRTPGIILAWYGDSWEARWDRTEEILKFVIRDTRAHGDALSIVAMPSPFQIEPVFREMLRSGADDRISQAFLEDIDRPQRHLRALCDSEGVPFVDLAPSLRAARNVPAYFLREGHLNELGASVVANALAETLRDRPVALSAHPVQRAREEQWQVAP